MHIFPLQIFEDSIFMWITMTQNDTAPLGRLIREIPVQIFQAEMKTPQTHELMLISKVTKYYFNYLFILYPIDQKSKNMSCPFTLYVLAMLNERIFFFQISSLLGVSDLLLLQF